MRRGAERVFAEAGALHQTRGRRRRLRAAGGAAHGAVAGAANRYDGFLLLGCVVKGETDHYTFICDAICNGVMRISADTGAAIGFGLLTVDTLQQALARAARRPPQQGGRGGACAARPGGAAAPLGPLMPGQKTEISELDRLRAEHEAEQRAQPAPAPQRPAGRRQSSGKARRSTGQKPAPAKARGRPRTGARVAAVQALFQSEQNNEPAEAVISQFQRHRLGTQPGDGGYEEGRVPEADVPLFAAIVMLVAQERRGGGQGRRRASRRRLADGASSTPCCGRCCAPPAPSCASRWPTAPPAKVLINEYLDIAHGFFGGDEPRFANGVLDAMARTLRAAEFAGPPRRRGG